LLQSRNDDRIVIRITTEIYFFVASHTFTPPEIFINVRRQLSELSINQSINQSINLFIYLLKRNKMQQNKMSRPARKDNTR